MSPIRVNSLLNPNICRRAVCLLASLLVACALQAATADHDRPRVAEGGGLLPVPVPNLEGLDKGVRFALQQARAELDSLIAGKAATWSELAEVFGETGLLYHAHLIFTPASVCYRNAAGLAPDDYRWPYYLGYVHEQNGRLEEAAGYYERALQLKPDLATVRLRLGRVYLEQDQLERAQPLLETAASVPELRGAALFALGRLAFTKKAFEQAAAYLREALEVNPQASQIHYTLALTYRALGDLGRARLHLDRGGAGEPGFPDPLIDALNALTSGQRTLFNYAMNAIYRDQYELAVRVFREGLKLDPNNLNARVSLARGLYLMGNRDAAKVELEAVVRQAPAHVLANFLLGVLEEEAGHSEEAIACYRQVLRVQPAHAGALFYLANRLMRNGRYAEAARHYALSLQQTPDNTYARLREILALIKAGAAQNKLRERLEDARARYPDDPAFAYFLASLLAASPDADVRDGKRALALARDLYEKQATPEHGELLAMAYAENGEFEKAERLQQDALATALAANRLDLVPGYMDDLSRFQARKPRRVPWGETGLQVGLPPVQGEGVFTGYPAESPY